MDERIKQLLLLGREHYQKREYDKAEPLLREVLQADDRFADVHDMLGVISHARGNFIAAEHHFERALAINPTYTEAALNLAVTYNDRGKYEAAREVYGRIRGKPSGEKDGLDPFARGKLANMHADIAQAYADLGLPRDAADELEKAVSLCPQFADLRTRLGNLLRELKELPRAREHYEAALSSRPGYVPARVALGVTLLSLGDLGGAEHHWKQVLDTEPDNPQVKMYLRMLDTEKRKSSLPPKP
ncbi:MAG TPA: tetratricopeptide repeat protein [Polyangiaceae bacterium]|jgi:tetratricopeptide (TPR) repeat protein